MGWGMIQRSIMLCEEIRSKIMGVEDSDEAFQQDFQLNLNKLRRAAHHGEIVMPSREELGDWLRQSSWSRMV